MSEFEPRYRITVEKQAQDGSWEAAPEVTPDDELDGFLLLGRRGTEQTEILGNLSKKDIVELLANAHNVAPLMCAAVIECVELIILNKAYTYPMVAAAIVT